MSTLIQSERNRQKLLTEIMPWWIKQGWNSSSLSKKSLQELIAIKARMLRAK